METSKSKSTSYLEYYPKNGMSPKRCPLKTGKYTIGFPSSHTFIKVKNQDEMEPVSCLIEVRDDRSAILESIDKDSVFFRGVKLKKPQILKNGNIFTISENIFRYMNNNLQTVTGAQDLVIFKRRQSVAPSFKTMNEKRKTVRRSSMMVKKKRISALCPKRRTRSSKSKLIKRESKRGRGGNGGSSVKTYKHKQFKKEQLLSIISHVSDSLIISDESWLSMSSYESASTSTTPNHFTKDQTLWKSSETLNSPSNDSTNANSTLKTKEHESLLNLSSSNASGSSTCNQSWPSFTSDDFESTVVTDLIRDTKSFRKPATSNLPLIDLTNVSGVNTKIIPRKRKSSKNDLIDICGIAKLFATPKAQKSPKNDLTDVRGVNKLFKTPNPQKSPKNDLSDVDGLEKLFKTSKNQNIANGKNPKHKTFRRIKKQKAELREVNPQQEVDIEEEVMEKKTRKGLRTLDEGVDKEETGVLNQKRKRYIIEGNKETIKTTKKRIRNGGANKSTDGSDDKQSGAEAQTEISSLDYKEVQEDSTKMNLRSGNKGAFNKKEVTRDQVNESERIRRPLTRSRRKAEEEEEENVNGQRRYNTRATAKKSYKSLY